MISQFLKTHEIYFYFQELESWSEINHSKLCKNLRWSTKRKKYLIFPNNSGKAKFCPWFWNERWILYISAMKPHSKATAQWIVTTASSIRLRKFTHLICSIHEVSKYHAYALVKGVSLKLGVVFRITDTTMNWERFKNYPFLLKALRLLTSHLSDAAK